VKTPTNYASSIRISLHLLVLFLVHLTPIYQLFNGDILVFYVYLLRELLINKITIMKKINSIFWAFAFVLMSHVTFGQCPYIKEVRLWDNSWSNLSGQSPNNYADYTNNCIPLFNTQITQINVTASQGNVFMAMYADLDGNGTFETQIFNFFDANGSTGVNPTPRDCKCKPHPLR
jgi:hypothetical protein